MANKYNSNKKATTNKKNDEEEFRPYFLGDKVKNGEVYQDKTESGWYRLRIFLTFESGKTYNQTVACSKKQFVGVELAED